MERTLQAIRQSITDSLRQAGHRLSQSAAAEWRLWADTVATAIGAFDLQHDLFRAEIEAAADKITPGTVRWYVEQSKRFQDGHELLFDNRTAQLYYATDAPASRIVSVVAVSEDSGRLSIKVASIDSAGHIVPLSPDQLYNFTGYIDSIKFAGIETSVVSTAADRIRYALQAWYDPAVPVTTVRSNIEAALSRFRGNLGFDSMFYRQQFLEAVMSAPGVVTAELESIQRKGTSMDDFAPVGTADELESGYFDYDPDSTLSLTSVKRMQA